LLKAISDGCLMCLDEAVAFGNCLRNRCLVFGNLDLGPLESSPQLGDLIAMGAENAFLNLHDVQLDICSQPPDFAHSLAHGRPAPFDDLPYDPLQHPRMQRHQRIEFDRAFTMTLFESRLAAISAQSENGAPPR